MTLLSDLDPERATDVVTEVFAADCYGSSDEALACGASYLMGNLLYQHTKLARLADDAGMFEAALRLYNRVMRSVTAGFWVETCDKLDALSVRLNGVWCTFVHARWFVGSAECEGLVSPSSRSWWRPLLEMAVENAELRLTSRPTVCFSPAVYSFMVLESGAKNEKQRSFLLGSTALESIEFACLNDYTFPMLHQSAAVYAGGAAVELVGRNEGGKTLSSEVVLHIAKGLNKYFGKGDDFYAKSRVKNILTGLSRVATMAISDSNKKLMLQCDGLVDNFIRCLLLGADNERRKQDGADVLQEVAAATLHELSLFAPWAQGLKAHSSVMSSLREVADVGTKDAKESAAAALFELDDEARGTAAKVAQQGGTESSSSSKPPPHIMMS
eukprot:COSAG04_NODE_7127_length_1185_cov_1.242173_1_plen_384_part_10